MDNTCLFNLDDIKKVEIGKILQEVQIALEERGYNSLNQITGYLLSGDPSYISSYKDSRNKILSLERSDIILFLLKNYIEL